MLIGELARQTGLTPDTIRFYEKRGLLDSSHIERQSNNYKDYGSVAVERLHFISRAKSAGFTLGETLQLVREWDTLNSTERLKVLLDKISQIDRRMAELEKMKGYLTAKVAAFTA